MDWPTADLQDEHYLYPRAGGLTGSPEDRPPVFKIVGLTLAIASGIFIGISFVVKKVGLLKANAKYNEEAGEGYGYLKNAWWWTGMVLMVIGEICNFVAYAFVDAILVTPLGALSVVVTTILSAIFLKERLSFVGKIGCFNCIVGSVVIVLNAPQQSSVVTIQDMKDFVIAPGFLAYAGVVIVGCIFVAFWVAPRYGKKSMLVYITICSLIGGLSVVATQGLGAAIITQIDGTPQFNQWFIYVLLVFVIATLLTEVVYLNKALNLFNAALVTPTYYVYFTSATIVSSAILFQGFKGTAMSITTVVMGFLQICSGVVLLQLSKSAKDVPDAAVFKGDLDQVRTVAEQEESEFEPHADAVRGSAFIARSISTSRQKREVQEAKRLQEEQLEPIGENEQVQWDGIRRRKTVVDHNQDGGSANRTVHPPLGMSYFPDDDDEANSVDDDHHPGIIPRIKNHNYTAWIPNSLHNLTSRHSNNNHSTPTVQLKGLNSKADGDELNNFNEGRRYTFGLPTGLRSANTQIPSSADEFDKAQTTYVSQIAYSSNTASGNEARNVTHLLPPTPPPHSSTNKRQFSFSNVFNRKKSGDSGRVVSGSSASAGRGLSFRSTHTGRDLATEEERLGLVKGDSFTTLPLTTGAGGEQSGDHLRSETDSENSDSKTEIITDSPPRYDSDGDGYLNVRKKPRHGHPAGGSGSTQQQQQQQQPVGNSGGMRGGRDRGWDNDYEDEDDDGNRNDYHANSSNNNNDLSNRPFGQGNSFF